jgi:hypothetical protein
VSQTVQEVTGHAARGSGDAGQCNYRLYGGGSWSDYNDLVRKVRAVYAQSLVTDHKLCLSASTSGAYTADCSAGTNVFVFTKGMIATADNRCLDGRGGHGNMVAVAPCNGSRSQQWWVFNDFGQVQNQQTSECLDIKGEGRGAGTPVINWTCSGSRPWNQKFVFGTVFPQSSLAGGQLRPTSASSISDLVSRNGAGVIAAGGGNVIAAGGGNVIAAGGGNVIAAGGGNLVAVGRP